MLVRGMEPGFPRLQAPSLHGPSCWYRPETNITCSVVVQGANRSLVSQSQQHPNAERAAPVRAPSLLQGRQEVIHGLGGH